MKWLKQLFSEESSVSCMRVMAMMSLITAIILAFLDKNSEVVVFLTAAMAGKVSQKFAENKSETQADLTKESDESK